MMTRSKTVLLKMERNGTFPREVVKEAVLKVYAELGVKLPKRRKSKNKEQESL